MSFRIRLIIPRLGGYLVRLYLVVWCCLVGSHLCPNYYTYPAHIALSMATTSMCCKGGVDRLVLHNSRGTFLPREMCHEVVSPDVVNRAELQASQRSQRSQLEEASRRHPGCMHVRTVASGSDLQIASASCARCRCGCTARLRLPPQLVG